MWLRQTHDPLPPLSPPGCQHCPWPDSPPPVLCADPREPTKGLGQEGKEVRSAPSPSQALVTQAKLELEARHPQSVRLPASRHTRLRDGRLVSDLQLANVGIIDIAKVRERIEMEGRNHFPLRQDLFLADLFGRGRQAKTSILSLDPRDTPFT